MRRCILLLTVAVFTAVALPAGANVAGLDRNSSDVWVDGAPIWQIQSIESEDQWIVTPVLMAKGPFQISLLGEVAPVGGTPGNGVWDFNHYTASDTHDWASGNFADYEYWGLQIDTKDSALPIYSYVGGTAKVVGSAQWTLNYYANGVSLQTVLAGDAELTYTIETVPDAPPFDTGIVHLTGYLRITPASGYRSFGDPPVNSVEMFGGETVLCDLRGYSLDFTGEYGSIDPDNDVRLTADLIPEPATMLGLLLSVGGVGAYFRRRRSA